MPASPIPAGYRTVTPYLAIRGASAVLDFLARAFDAVEVARTSLHDGTIVNAEVRVGDSMVMVAEAGGGQDPQPATLYMYVMDTDATYRRAIEAGGVSLMEPVTAFYGDRSAGVRDPGGNSWWIATHVEDVPADEIDRRANQRDANRSGRVPAFLAAVTSGDEAAVRAALAEVPSLAWARNDAGVSAICLAVYHGKGEVATLLASRRDDVDIFEASVIGNAGRVATLIAASPGLIDAFSPDGFQPLGYACFFGHRTLFDLLLGGGAAVETVARNATAVRPIHSAAAQRDRALALDLVGRLLAAGASPNVAQQGGFTPLHQAAHSGHLELVKLLLEHGADREARAADGRSPAEMAREGGHAAAAVLLGG